MFDFENATVLTEYGIITTNTDKINNLTDEQKNNYRTLSHRNRIKCMADDKKIINKLWVSPVGHLCRGECIYCCNNAFTMNAPNNLFMTPDNYASKIKKLLPYLNTLSVSIAFWGGSAFLSPYIKEMIEITIDLLGDRKLNFEFYNDLMLNDSEYAKMIEVFDYIEKEPLINNVVTTMSPDYGSFNSRISNKLGINNLYLQEKTEELVDRYSKSKKILSRVSSLILEDTNILELTNSFEYYMNKDVYIMFDIVEHQQYSPSLTKCKEVRKIIENKYNVISTYMNRYYLIENDFLTKTKYNNEYLTNIFYEIDNDTLIFDPSTIACSAFKGKLAFNAISYSPCSLMYIEVDSIEKCMSTHNQYHGDESMSNIFTYISDECNECELLYMCNRCAIRKKTCKCSEIESLKFRVNWTWDCICKNNDLIKIHKLK